MRAWRVFQVCVLAFILALFTLLQPVSFESYPPVLLAPGGGVPIGLAQGGEEEIGSVGVVVDEPSWPDESTELVGKRSLTSKTYQVGPDQYQALISTLPMHYKDDAGAWQDIDTTLRPQPDGSYYSGANLVKARFPGQLGAGQGISIEIPGLRPDRLSSRRLEANSLGDLAGAGGSEELSVTWQPVKLAYSSGEELGALEVSSARVGSVSALASDNLITYGNAFPGVAEEFRVIPGGVKHSLVLSRLPDLVPPNPPPDSFLDYQVAMSLSPDIGLYVDGVEQTSDFSTSSPIELRRIVKAGQTEIVGYLLPPFAYERDNPRLQTPSLHLVHFEPGQIMLTVRTPLSWLVAPERTYPVVIDPWTTADLWQDTFMSSGYPTFSFGDFSGIYSGYDPTYGFDIEKSLMRWSVEPIPYDSTINSAWIYLYQFFEQGVSTCDLAFYPMLVPWSSSYVNWYNRGYGTSWNVPGAGGYLTDYGFGYVLTFDDRVDDWQTMSSAGFATWVQDWIDGTSGNYGVMLKPVGNPATHDCERGFRTMNYEDGWAGPLLWVDYTFTGTITLLQDLIPQTHTYPDLEDYYQEDSAVHTSYWRGTALRPLGQSDYDLWLHTQPDFSDWEVSSRQGVGRVDYTLINWTAVVTEGYPRVVHYYGIDNYDIEYQYRLAQLNPPYDWNWSIPANAVWNTYEVYLSSPGSWQVVVTPLSGNPDLGVAIHSGPGDYHTRGSALALSDQVGPNLAEQFEFTGLSSGWYGLVVWSNQATGFSQGFRLEIKQPPLKSYLPIVLKDYVPPQGPFSNGGFENDSRWTLSGELEHERTTAKKRSGSYSLRLGHDDSPSSPCLGSVPCSGSGDACESVAIGSQGFDVPNSGSPALSFYYQIYTYDHQPSGDRAPDYFGAYIREGITETLVYLDDLSWVGSDYNCDKPVNKKDTWQLVSSIDLSPYKGKTVELIFKVTNGGHNFWNTWVFIDDVACRDC